MVSNIISSINDLVKYWEKQNIMVNSNSLKRIENVQKNNDIFLPLDFKIFFSVTNGMEQLFPNEMDNEGFLFYPLDAVYSSKLAFKNSALGQVENLYIFAEYMHKSWWYALKVDTDDKYSIGIIPNKNIFKPITNSLAIFINLYIKNSEELYDYE